MCQFVRKIFPQILTNRVMTHSFPRPQEIRSADWLNRQILRADWLPRGETKLEKIN